MFARQLTRLTNTQAQRAVCDITHEFLNTRSTLTVTQLWTQSSSSIQTKSSTSNTNSFTTRMLATATATATTTTTTATTTNIKSSQETSAIQEEINKFKQEQNTPTEEANKYADYYPAPKNMKERMAFDSDPYIDKPNLRDHTMGDLGRYYQIPDHIVESMPNQLHKCTKREFDAVKGPINMIRNPGWKIVQSMKNWQGTPQEKAQVKEQLHCIYGPVGFGKSFSINYIAQYALQAGWLLIPIDANEFSSDVYGLISPNKQDPTIYDQPRMTKKYFEDLINNKLISVALSKIKLKLPASKASLGNTADTTLLDLLQQGCKVASDMTAVLTHFCNEIAIANEVPVLIAIDSINRWDMDSPFVDPNDTFKQIPSGKLALVNKFTRFVTEAPANGMSVYATSSLYSSEYIDLLRKCAHKSHEMRTLRHEQLVNVMKHYHTSQYIATEATEDNVAFFKIMTGSIPAQALRVAATL